MTDQWNYRSGVHDAPTPDAGPDSNGRAPGWDGDRWRRPRRSAGDRKIAGVAGGLGRAFGIDPILIRVIFVVLTVFGGFGGLLYVLGWLLLPADGDEVSAAEALLGRGRSSVPPPLAVGLGIIAVISAFSIFSWGLRFLPLAIGGLIVVTVLRKRGHGHLKPGQYDWHGKDWDRSGGGMNSDWASRTDDRVRAFTEQAQRWGDQMGQRWGDQAQRWGDQAQQWGDQVGRRSGGRGCSSRSGWNHRGHDRSSGAQQPAGPSPFPEPPFWEQPAPGTPKPGASPVDLTKDRVDPTKDGVDLTKGGVDRSKGSVDPTANDAAATGWPGPDGRPVTTPPAWDPLGAAPFAWDLPDPAPLPDPGARPQRRTVLPQVTLGTTLLVGAALTAGVFAGWWALTWAQVSGLTLAVLAVGLLFSALRGGGRSLIGGGVFLSLVTLALAVTGLSGTSAYGSTDVRPTSLAELQDSYRANAGELGLDLRSLTIPRGTTRTVDVDLKAGHALVQVPAGMTVHAVCSADVGHTECLGGTSDGVRKESTGTATGSTDSGTLQVNVHLRAGFAEVVSGD